MAAPLLQPDTSIYLRDSVFFRYAAVPAAISVVGFLAPPVSRRKFAQHAGNFTFDDVGIYHLPQWVKLLKKMGRTVDVQVQRAGGECANARTKKQRASRRVIDQSFATARSQAVR
jgi:hypothetical protein